MEYFFSLSLANNFKRKKWAFFENRDQICQKKFNKNQVNNRKTKQRQKAFDASTKVK